MSQLKRSQGFTLIEVLVATLVLTVGVMGVAAMQMVSFQTNQSAYARSQAIYLAQDILDRIRANRSGYEDTVVYDDIDTSDANTIPASPNCITTNTGCTPTQMAQQDIREWAQHFTNVSEVDDFRPKLPAGRGVVARIGATNEFSVTISWDERDFDAEGNLTRTMNTRSVNIRTTLN